MLDSNFIRQISLVKNSNSFLKIIDDKRIKCNFCKHSWDINTGGKKPFLCHSCLKDNTTETIKLY